MSKSPWDHLDRLFFLLACIERRQIALPPRCDDSKAAAKPLLFAALSMLDDAHVLKSAPFQDGADHFGAARKPGQPINAGHHVSGAFPPRHHAITGDIAAR